MVSNEPRVQAACFDDLASRLIACSRNAAHRSNRAKRSPHLPRGRLFCFRRNASKPVTDFTLHERHTETISFRFGNHRSTPFAPGKSEAIISNIPPDVYLALNACA